jgi:hypothetical protein
METVFLQGVSHLFKGTFLKLFACFLFSCYIFNMTIEQTVEIPADHRVFFEFLAPKEIPIGPARLELKVTPVLKRQAEPETETGNNTPLTDALSGILSSLGDISLEQIRDERLAKHLK